MTPTAAQGSHEVRPLRPLEPRSHSGVAARRASHSTFSTSGSRQIFSKSPSIQRRGGNARIGDLRPGVTWNHSTAEPSPGWPRFLKSGREDLNLRPPAPKAGALPGCATPRIGRGQNTTAPKSSRWRRPPRRPGSGEARALSPRAAPCAVGLPFAEFARSTAGQSCKRPALRPSDVASRRPRSSGLARPRRRPAARLRQCTPARSQDRCCREAPAAGRQAARLRGASGRRSRGTHLRTRARPSPTPARRRWRGPGPGSTR